MRKAEAAALIASPLCSGMRAESMKGNRRLVGVGASLLTHLIVLWAILPHAPKPAPEPGVMSVSLLNGPALSAIETTAQASPPPPSQRPPDDLAAKPDLEPLPVKDAFTRPDPTAEPIDLGKPVGVEVAASVAAAAASASQGDPCALGEWLQNALQTDPAVQAALADVPRSARSVANAVMLWNGSWPQPSAEAAAGMTSIRAIVMAGVASAPVNCQVQPIIGPVLITVGDDANATILAVGSGNWRWQDLLNASGEIQ